MPRTAFAPTTLRGKGVVLMGHRLCQFKMPHTPYPEDKCSELK
jgi:hypothetical protein